MKDRYIEICLTVDMTKRQDTVESFIDSFQCIQGVVAVRRDDTQHGYHYIKAGRPGEVLVAKRKKYPYPGRSGDSILQKIKSFFT